MGLAQRDGRPLATVTLEPLRVEHADEMWPVLADAALYEFMGGEPPSRDALARRYRSQVAGSGQPEESWRNWIVRRTDCGEAVGFVQATIVDGTAEIAWLIGVNHQGQGFASRAVRKMVEELAVSGVADLTAHIRPDHRRSQDVASAVGLERTGAVDDEGEEIWARSTSR